MTDPISDLLTRMRNAMLAKHPTVDVPASRMKLAILEILKQEGYIDDYARREQAPQAVLSIRLKYRKDGGRVITGVERVSRPGRRVYRGKYEIPQVLNGLGITIVSTSRGVMTGQACRRMGLGGEVLCNVW